MNPMQIYHHNVIQLPYFYVGLNHISCLVVAIAAADVIVVKALCLRFDLRLVRTTDLNIINIP